MLSACWQGMAASASASASARCRWFLFWFWFANCSTHRPDATAAAAAGGGSVRARECTLRDMQATRQGLPNSEFTRVPPACASARLQAQNAAGIQATATWLAVDVGATRKCERPIHPSFSQQPAPKLYFDLFSHAMDNSCQGEVSQPASQPASQPLLALPSLFV